MSSIYMYVRERGLLGIMTLCDSDEKYFFHYEKGHRTIVYVCVLCFIFAKSDLVCYLL